MATPGLEGLSAQQRAQVNARLEQLQMQDSLQTFNGIVERCFSECINSFISKRLSETETKCVESCVHKFLNYSQRVGQRFAEITSQRAS